MKVYREVDGVMFTAEAPDGARCMMLGPQPGRDAAIVAIDWEARTYDEVVGDPRNPMSRSRLAFPEKWYCVDDLEWSVDPLEVEYDGVELRLLLEQEEMRQRTERPLRQFEPLTPAQRAAVSAHWSAELRAKVAASAERDRNRVVVDQQDLEREPWR